MLQLTYGCLLPRQRGARAVRTFFSRTILLFIHRSRRRRRRRRKQHHIKSAAATVHLVLRTVTCSAWVTLLYSTLLCWLAGLLACFVRLFARDFMLGWRLKRREEIHPYIPSSSFSFSTFSFFLLFFRISTWIGLHMLAQSQTPLQFFFFLWLAAALQRRYLLFCE